MTIFSRSESRRPRLPEPVEPGFAPDTIARLSGESLKARMAERDNRDAAFNRKVSARRLAGEVAELPRPEPLAEPMPEVVKAEPVKPKKSPKPWRAGGLRLKVPKAPTESAPAPQSADTAALGRIADRGGQPDRFDGLQRPRHERFLRF